MEITLKIFMNLWLELDNCLSVAQLVRALHRNRRAAGSIPVRLGLNKFIKFKRDYTSFTADRFANHVDCLSLIQ